MRTYESVGRGERCPECYSDKVGEIVMVEEVRALEQGGAVVSRDPVGYGNPRYMCGDCTAYFNEPSYPVPAPGETQEP